MRRTLGDASFSSSDPGSASTVTLIFQGLAPPGRPVFNTIDLDGEEKSIMCSDTLSERVRLFGEL
jgi:hypothetical protein